MSAEPVRVTTRSHREFLTRQAEMYQRFLDLVGTDRGVARTAADPEPAVIFGREQLLHHASGRISELFGDQFRTQDGYPRQARLPEPPMLLVDRVTGLRGRPATMGTGGIRTETDIRTDSWYLDPAGRMPAGILVEAGQAELLLMSWLGVDLLNRGERVHRLLGCELTFHGSLPRSGHTLDYAIGVDAHHRHGDVRLFSFHSECLAGGRPRLTLRHGLGGFFTDQELAGGGGVQWRPDDEAPRDDGPVEPPAVAGDRRTFDAEAVRAFTEGRAADCFGDAWRLTRAHVRSPRTASGRMRLLGEVTAFRPDGGPWGRGYLRAETPVRPDDWFFAGHFRDDPCIPGTLMLEASLQAMGFYLAATGCTIDRDGWRFEPVPDESVVLRWRGQVTPRSKQLSYEVFVSGFSASGRPTLHADILCTVDGLPVFHARRLGLRLVPDWPLEHWRHLGPPATQRTGEPVPPHALGGLVGHRPDPAAAVVDGIRYDHAALLGSSWGQAGALPAMYSGVGEGRRIPRLPGPPYLFMTRVVVLRGERDAPRPGAWIEAEYDVPDAAWFFDATGAATMPLAALIEVALQPCGVLAMYTRKFSSSGIDLFFRLLDGDLRWGQPIPAGSRRLRVRASLRTQSQFGESIIQTYDVTCHAGDAAVLSGTATFGFFTGADFANQPGLPPSEVELSRLDELNDVAVDLRRRPARYCGGPLRLPGPMLLMLDRITGFWPDGGQAGLGRLRAEKELDPDAWYFKAHFFTDPVQPGSLGLEAMCQLLQFFCLERDLARGIPHPRFEPVLPESRIRWTFRGQIVPADGVMTVEAEITEVTGDDRGRLVQAQAWLWVDGRRIYHASGIGVRIVPGSPADPAPAIVEHVLDPDVDTWLGDHLMHWAAPAVPMMSTVDLLASAATELTGQPVVELSDLCLRRWLPASRPVRLRTTAARAGADITVALQVWRDSPSTHLSRFETVATTTVRTGTPGSAPAPLPVLAGTQESTDPYESGDLFHGPAFAYLTSLGIGRTGSTATLDAGRGWVPRGCLHQGLLDALTHLVPHGALWRWAGDAARGRVGYPHRIRSLRLYRPLPDRGELRAEARFAGFDDGDERFPVVDIQLCQGELVLAELCLIDMLFPARRLGRVAPAQLRSFLRDREYVHGVGLALATDTETTLVAAEVAALDWLPDGVAAVYGLSAGAGRVEQVAHIAVKDHVAHRVKVHPSRIEVASDLARAWPAEAPDDCHRVVVTDHGDRVVVRDG